VKRLSVEQVDATTDRQTDRHHDTPLAGEETVCGTGRRDDRQTDRQTSRYSARW